jgi:transposase InsO family protein
MRLKDCVREFHQGGEAKCTRHPHPFFGNLTPQEWSRGMYKHLDHHLRQFGA